MEAPLQTHRDRGPSRFRDGTRGKKNYRRHQMRGGCSDSEPLSDGFGLKEE